MKNIRFFNKIEERPIPWLKRFTCMKAFPTSIKP